MRTTLENGNDVLLALTSLELGLRWLHDRCYTPLFSLLGQRHRTYWDGRLDGAVDSYYRSLPDAIELGLRWLHDRAEEDSNAVLAEVILEKAPVVLNGLLSALAFDYAQKFAEIPRDAVTARELRKRWKNMKRNRLKKDIP